jgi:phosphoribosylaminoimidazolecarboxamide formyltransferase/IMP cyclohydrolase
LQLLAASKNLRLLVCDIAPEARGALELRSVAGGFLVQTRDGQTGRGRRREVVSKRAPTPEELRDLDFAWRVCKHVKSNASSSCPAAGPSASAPARCRASIRSYRRVEGARAAGWLGRCVRRFLPVPRQRR